MSESEISEIPTSELWVRFHDSQGRDRLEYADEICIRLRAEAKWVEILALAETALGIPEAQDDPHLTGRLYWEIGYASYSLGRFSESVTAYQAAKEAYLRANSIWNAGISVRNAVDGLWEQDLHSIILDVCTEAIEFCESETVYNPLGDLYFRKARSLDMLGLAESALETFEKARHYYQIQENDEGLLSTDYARIRLFRATGRATDAVELAERVLVIARSKNSSHALFHAVHALAQSFYSAKQYVEVLRLLDECEPVIFPDADFNAKTILKNLRAYALSEIGHDQESLDSAREASVFASYLNDPSLQFESLSFAYWQADRMGERPIAESLASQYLVVAQQNSYSSEIFRARVWLARAALERDDPKLAAEHLGALDEFDLDTVDLEIGLEYHWVKALHHLLLEEYATAQAVAETGLTYSNEMGWIENRARLLGIHAEAMLKQGKTEPMGEIMARAVGVLAAKGLPEAADLGTLMSPDPHLQFQLELEI